MATWNKKLHSLTKEDIIRISENYLLGWHNLEKDYGFRIKGLNSIRKSMNLEPLTKQMSDEYRLSYIRNKYSDDEIFEEISKYLQCNRVSNARWVGIELFGCRFGREYARLFKELLGASKYRQIAESLRRDKSVETQIQLYGGVGLAGQNTKDKALTTVMERYGVRNVMQNPQIKQKLGVVNQKLYGSISPFGSDEIRSRLKDMRCENIAEAMFTYKKTGYLDERMFSQSPQELAALYMLGERFGMDDVYYQYGIHPSDDRYPYNCDFYIKSKDLFIELNGHYTHGNHWFDAKNHDDLLRVKHLMDSGKAKNKEAVRIWIESDPMKRESARKANLRYLVFWDGDYVRQTKPRIPRLNDFRIWLYEYDADYDKFIKDFPCNTY